MSRENIAGFWIPLTVSVRTPYITGGYVVPQLSLDIPSARDADGRHILPGSLVKGNFRHLLLELAKAGAATPDGQEITEAEVLRLFGGGLGDVGESQLESNLPGQIAFFDLRLLGDSEALSSESRSDAVKFATRVEIDPLMGSAKKGNLAFIEMAFGANQICSFQNELFLSSGDRNEAERAVDLLKFASQYLVSIGSNKSAGFGVVDKVDVNDVRPIELATSPADSEVQGPISWFELRPTEPFLVDLIQNNSNILQGSAVIPGGTLKATFASLLINAYGEQAFAAELSGGLSKITISAAHVHSGNRATWGEITRVLPNSLAVQGDNVLDLAFANDKTVLDHVPLTFAADWKPKEQDLTEACCYPGETGKLRRQVASHTAIEQGGYAALFSALFTEVRTVGSAVGKDAHAADPWVFYISWNGVSRTGTLAKALEQLFVNSTGLLGGLGRGSVPFHIQHAKKDHYKINRFASDTEEYAVKLTTPALLLGPDSYSDDVEAAYVDYWARHGLELVDFFASQTLEGGSRAALKPLIKGQYQPYVLTNPGAVFVLCGGKASDMNELLESGLSLPKSLAGKTWRDCPYMPENGYGQIVVHGPADHVTVDEGGAS